MTYKSTFQSSANAALMNVIKSMTEFTEALGHFCILSANRYWLEELFAITSDIYVIEVWMWAANTV